MSGNSWQHPFVNIFKYFDINSAKKCLKHGDISTIIDRDLKSIVYRIRGLIPENNYIQFPSECSNKNLRLTGHLFYVLFRPMFNKNFCVHIDVITHKQHVIHISISNNYREFKLTQTSIQFPYTSTGADIHWSVLCLDLQVILLTYMTNEYFRMIKSFQLCGNMFVKNCFSSQFLYEPGIDNDTAKRTGLTRAGIRSLPRELSYPIDRGESWHSKYDFIMFPNMSSIAGKNSSEPFDKVGNVRLPTPKKLPANDQALDQDVNSELLPLTVQTTVVNGKLNRSLTDFAFITQKSASSADVQLNWRTYDNPNDFFSPLPNLKDSSTSSCHQNNSNNDGIHVFVRSQTASPLHSISSDSNRESPVGTIADNLSQSQLRVLLPDPILRLQTSIGLSNGFRNFFWTQDSNYVVYASNAIVTQMHVDTQQQWFFIGHTDKITAIAFNSNSSLLATIQTGSNAILRLWQFETRRCISITRILNVQNLHGLDFGIGDSSSSSLVVVGHDNRSQTVVCVYNASNISKDSLELISRATTPISISHIRFVPYDTTKFVSIGPDNINIWCTKNDTELKSMKVLINDTDYFEYTDLQFEYLSNNKFNESVAYIATKSGHILELLHSERRILRTYNLSDAVSTKFTISTLACTDNFRITGSDDGYIRVWPKDFSQIFIAAKYDQAICGLTVSSDQTRVFIVTISGSLSVLNLITKSHVSLMRTHTKSITDVDYDETRKQFITTGQDGTIRIWCFRTMKQLCEFTSERDIPRTVTYAPDRQTFACGFHSGTIKIFDLTTSILLNEVKHHETSITGLVYSHQGSYLLSSDEEGDLCLSDAMNNYELSKGISQALISSNKGPVPLSMSSDGKFTVYVGPTEFIVTVIDASTLNPTSRIDLKHCTYETNDQRTITLSESASFARFITNRYIFVATKNFKLLKFDTYTGLLLIIVDDTHKYSLDSLALSSNNQYLVTTGDGTLKFWDADMQLDVNFQVFVGHSESIRKICFTDDNMHVVSIGDSILIWNVLAWNTTQPSMPNNGQCLVAPQSVMEKILEHIPIQSRNIQRSLSSSEIDGVVTCFQDEKKTINKKLLTKTIDEECPTVPTFIRRHFIQRINHSQLAKKRYLAPMNEESLKIQVIIGYNGNGRDNLVWHPDTGFYAFTVGCNIIVENLNSNQQTVLIGHTEEISTLALSSDGTILASAECSLPVKKEELQAKIIIWNTKILQQKTSFHVSVQALQSMAFSKDSHYLAIIGNYRKPTVTIWSMNERRDILNWHDKIPSFYINCMAWNPIRMNEFCLGGAYGMIRFCTINESNDTNKSELQVVNGEIPSSINEQTKISCDITACAYLTSIANFVLCATSQGLITCWNSRLSLFILNWKADSREICYLATTKHKLLTGSSTGCLRLWDIESLEKNFEQSNSVQLKFGFKMQDEFQLDDGIVSGSFDNAFDMGIVGTSCGSLWYICWTTDRSKTRLTTSHTDEITGLIPIEDTHIATGSLDGTIRIFQLHDRNEILRFKTHGSKVTCLTSWNSVPPMSNNNSNVLHSMKHVKSSIHSIVAGCNDGTVRVFSLVHEQIQSKLQPHESSIAAIHIPSNTIICLSGSSDGSVAISNLIQGTLLRLVNEHLGSAPICLIDSQKLEHSNLYMWLISGHDQRISLWKSNPQFDLCTFFDWLSVPESDSSTHWQLCPPSLARFIDDNQIIYVDSCMRIYDIEKKQIIRTIRINHWCTCFDISNIKIQHGLIALGTKDRLVQLKDYTQETFQDFIGNPDRITNIKFNRSNDLLITTSSNEIFIWKMIFN